MIQSNDGALAIAKAIHRTDPLSAVTDTFSKFSAVLHAVGGETESLKNFESRFDAAVSGYNATAPSAKLPESLVAFILVGNARLSDSQRISIPSAAAPKASDSDDSPLHAATPNSQVLSKSSTTM